MISLVKIWTSVVTILILFSQNLDLLKLFFDISNNIEYEKLKIGEINGRYQNKSGNYFNFSMIRDSLFLEAKQKQTGRKDSSNVMPVIWHPNKAFGFKSIPKEKNILFKNATIWTNEAEGILQNSDLIISNGQIIAIGILLNPIDYFKEEEYETIDASKLHLTSGIIDEHSHIAISRGVNEASEAVSAEVRIGDVINPNDHNIYRQLSGGTVVSQLLHGSANPIGGRSAIIKLKWGESASNLIFKNSPKFIKFALGENVKQSNWQSYNRFPQSRMGVEQLFIDLPLTIFFKKINGAMSGRPQGP